MLLSSLVLQTLSTTTLALPQALTLTTILSSIYVNNRKTTDVNDPVWEFYRVPFTEFADVDGNSFADIGAAIEYINQEANVAAHGGGAQVIEATTAFGFTRDYTDTTVLFDNGDSRAVNSIRAYANEDGLINIAEHGGGADLYIGLYPYNTYIDGVQQANDVDAVVNALNALFTVTAAGAGTTGGTVYVPVEDGVEITYNFQEHTDPVGDNIAAVDSNGQHNARMWSTETIDEPGEFFTVRMAYEGQFGLGLYSTADGDLTEITNDTGNGHSGYKWSNWFYDYGTYIAPWTLYGSNTGFSYGPGWNGSASQKLSSAAAEQADLDSGVGILFKVGITVTGYAAVWYWNSTLGDWVMTARSSYILPEDSYGLLVKLATGGVQIVGGTGNEVLRYAVDPVAPALHYRYIESPDGLFHYPLFSTEEEANWIDTENGGSGTSTTQYYLDEPTMTGWFLPDTGSVVDAGSAPVNANGIVYTAIPTEADHLYAPAAFSGNDFTLDEGEAVNIPLQPADATFITTVEISPSGSGLVLTTGNLQGTAPEVSSTSDVNPSDVYTVTVTRTNAYGSSAGTFDIIVTNLTHPTTTATGFTNTHGSSTDNGDGTTTLGEGAVINIDDTLEAGKRLIVSQAWVEQWVLPNLENSLDKVYIGAPKATADWTEVQLHVDFDAVLRWEWLSGDRHRSSASVGDSANANPLTINSATDSFFDYAIEWDGTDLHVIRCNVSSLMNEPGIAYGGTFTQVITYSGFPGATPIQLVIATKDVGATVGLTGLEEIDIPLPATFFNVTESAHVYSFNGSTDAPTLNAGYTYRFLVEDASVHDQIKFTADLTTEYTTGVTVVGTPGTAGAYVEFAVPSDAPPLYYYDELAGPSSGTTLPISGSTYVEPVTGISTLGPVANITGNDLTDTAYFELTETLDAGQRLVFNKDFLQDLYDELDDTDELWIGIKVAAGFTDTDPVGDNVDGPFFKIVKSTNFLDLIVYSMDSLHVGSAAVSVTGGLVQDEPSAFIEISGSGNNIRVGVESNLADDAGTTAYADWATSGAAKEQSGDQGYGITARNVVFRYLHGGVNPMELDLIDWTSLYEINVPTVSAGLTTPWGHALDFSGSNEYGYKVNGHTSTSPLIQYGAYTAEPAAGFTNSDGDPWAVACVFNHDGNPSNQVVWCQSEGASTGDDSIQLRISSSNVLYFEWGREGSGWNSCAIGQILPGFWYGLYVDFNGYITGGTGATAASLAERFRFKMVALGTGVVTTAANSSTNWVSHSTRMDRTVVGDFAIGGRLNNRSWHGAMGAVVVTSLKNGVNLPDDAEVSMMVRDPMQWLIDYKIGFSYRATGQNYNNADFQLNDTGARSNTQVWLMGDGTSDAYALMRNQVHPGDQNYTALRMNSMISDDIISVNIPGLTS